MASPLTVSLFSRFSLHLSPPLPCLLVLSLLTRPLFSILLSSVFSPLLSPPLSILPSLPSRLLSSPLLSFSSSLCSTTHIAHPFLLFSFPLLLLISTSSSSSFQSLRTEGRQKDETIRLLKARVDELTSMNSGGGSGRGGVSQEIIDLQKELSAKVSEMAEISRRIGVAAEIP